MIFEEYVKLLLPAMILFCNKHFILDICLGCCHDDDVNKSPDQGRMNLENSSKCSLQPYSL